jgi:tetratricopeptide (TPR) repeat protein
MLVNCAKAPSNLHSILERAEEHLEAGDLWLAESFFFEAQNIKSNSARAMCGLGRVDLKSGNYSGAKDKFRAAMVMNPDYVDTYKYLFDLAEQTDDHASLLDSAKQLHQLSPENPRYPLIMANLLLKAGDADGSEEFFKLTIKLSPKVASAHRGLGHVYLQKRDYENAQKSLEKALDLENQDISTLNSLGLTYVKMQLIDRGIEKYRMALSINPRDARVLFNLALAFEEKGDEASMRDSLLRAAAVDPSFEKAKKKLANIGNFSLKDEPAPFLIQSDEDDILNETQKKGA